MLGAAGSHVQKISRRALHLEHLEARQLLTAVIGDGGVLTDVSADLWSRLKAIPVSEEGMPSFLVAKHMEPYALNRALMESMLESAPLEFSPESETSPLELAVATPDGDLDLFRVTVSPIMAPELAAQFPEIQTYSGQGIDDPAATIRFDVTPAGFHAQVLSPNGAYYVDPYYHLEDSVYVSYYKHDAVEPIIGPRTIRAHDIFDGLPQLGDRGAGDPMGPFVPGLPEGEGGKGDGGVWGRSGTQLRTYRAAVAATGEYTTFHGGTVSAGMAAITTAINRVSGIYETELSIRLELVANNSLIVYTNAATDPYTNNDPGKLLDENQVNLDAVIGDPNYDIGHVFSTGGGGLAGLGVVGRSGVKAWGETGLPSPVGDTFYVDFVAHEMGHQFGGNHTFNGDSGSCSGSNRNGSTAYEPGSGSTIQAYAGICGNDDLQAHSDPYFHSVSFDEIISYVDNVIPSVGARTNTGNNVPTVEAGPNYVVPARTPFQLTAAGSDADTGDILTYNWEERDLGPQQDVSAPDNGSSPIFRSWEPTEDPTRVFPRLSDLLNNTTVIGEKLPTTTRTMHFRATVRDNQAGGGGVNTDDMVLQVIDTGVPFMVTSPNTEVTWPAFSTQVVSWDVAGTDVNGIDEALVNVLLSADGGLTYPYTLLSETPNDGTQQIVVPNIDPTTTARIRVEAANSVFFDVSNVNFTVTGPEFTDDYGDAPSDLYPTLEADDGPRHQAGTLFLGNMVDTEPDGQPNADATGDGSDEDGIFLIEPLVAGATVNIGVVSSSGGGQLDYFFDFDGSAGFGNNANEVFTATLAGGVELLPVTIPADAVAGTTFARFRISSGGGLGPAGPASDGEVEDYAFTVYDTAPRAILVTLPMHLTRRRRRIWERAILSVVRNWD